MWPWEHLAVGYLAYAALARLRGRRVGEWSALAVVLGTQFPDLVDKPLSWTLNVLPAGVFAHTLIVAVPVSLVAVLFAHRYDRTAIGLGFAVGYLSHLPADALPPAVLGNGASWWLLFWPFVPRPGSAPVSDPILGPGAGAGVLANAEYYFGGYLDALLGPAGIVYVGVEVLLVGGALAVWLRDDKPGLAVLENLLAGRGARSERR